jgi:hypothetical protein
MEKESPRPVRMDDVIRRLKSNCEERNAIQDYYYYYYYYY